MSQLNSQQLEPLLNPFLGMSVSRSVIIPGPSSVHDEGARRAGPGEELGAAARESLRRGELPVHRHQRHQHHHQRRGLPWRDV